MSQKRSLATDGLQRIFSLMGRGSFSTVNGTNFGKSLCSTAEKNADVQGVVRSRIKLWKQDQSSGL